MTGKPDRLIVGISGASGAILGIKALQLLQHTDIETHLVISKAAALTISSETDSTVETIKSLADVTYPCLLYTSPSPRDGLLSRMPSSA